MCHRILVISSCMPSDEMVENCCSNRIWNILKLSLTCFLLVFGNYLEGRIFTPFKVSVLPGSWNLRCVAQHAVDSSVFPWGPSSEGCTEDLLGSLCGPASLDRAGSPTSHSHCSSDVNLEILRRKKSLSLWTHTFDIVVLFYFGLIVLNRGYLWKLWGYFSEQLSDWIDMVHGAIECGWKKQWICRIFLWGC